MEWFALVLGVVIVIVFFVLPLVYLGYAHLTNEDLIDKLTGKKTKKDDNKDKH